MNKIIDAFIKNQSLDDPLHGVYGISSDEHFDCAFIAPSWQMEKVFNTNTTDITPIFQDRFSKSFRIKSGNKNYLYIQLQVGAPSIIDFCICCYKTNCDKFVFVGSAGALTSDINIGDVIIPDMSISGNGATLYLHDTLDAKNMFEKTYSSQTLNNQIRNICNDLNINTQNETVISVDSLACEYQHLDEFREMGATIIEMETATFFKAMELINKNASAILIVSDNSAAGQHLVGQSMELRAKYHAVRNKIQDILLQI